MNIVAFVLLLVAAACFAIGANIVHPKLASAAFCLLTLGLIAQFAAKSHGITF